MFNNSALDVNSLGLVTPEANRLGPSSLQHNSGIPISRSSGRSIAFVDPGLSDVQTLTARLQADTTVYLLDSVGDELSQITAVLAGYQDLASVAILSHGRDGGLQLGSSWLDSNSLMGQAGLVQSWAAALGKGADLLLYGCDVAADAIGQGFVQQLAALTGADVAASSNLTGSAALGGDWVLEYQTGTIEAAVLGVANYASVLATFNVTNRNDFGAGSMRDAISKANSAPGADTIEFTASFFKDAVPDVITLATGELNISSDITINGTGASKLIINGNNASRVFNIISGNVTIGGLSITKGQVAESLGSGGGIYNRGTLILNGVTVRLSKAAYQGGGILNSGTLTLNNSTVIYNDARSFGGGIANFGTLTLNNSTVSGNTGSGYGGGILNSDSINTFGTLTLNNSTVSGNTASEGGGIYNSVSKVTLNNSTISGNKASLRGGGIANLGDLALNNSVITGNTAISYGGGIYTNSNSFNGTILISGTTKIINNNAPTGRNIYGD
jgi:Domain of unknown function (DUF4347)